MQAELIAKTIDCARSIFNFVRGLQKRQQEDVWAMAREMVQQGYFAENTCKGAFFSKVDAIHGITELKKTCPWLQEVDKYALQCAVEALDAAYQRHYKHKGGRPKFKSKKNPLQSYTTKSNFTRKADGTRYPGTIRTEDKGSESYVRLPKIGCLRIAHGEKLRLEGRILRATLTRTFDGQYYVSTICENVAVKTKPVTGKQTGIDAGLIDHSVFADGTHGQNPEILDRRILSHIVRETPI